MSEAGHLLLPACGEKARDEGAFRLARSGWRSPPDPLPASGERGGETAPLFVYLAYGRSPAAERELRYSLETLRAEVGDAPVAIYTDRPAAFADLGATVIDAFALIREAFAHAYRHRLKPMALADALRRFGRPCVMLDLDSFVRPGFAASVARALEQGAAMNFFVRADPYPDFPAFETDLPHLGRYRLDRAKARMLNSGLVAVAPAHLPLVEDAVALIDRLWAGRPHAARHRAIRARRDVAARRRAHRPDRRRVRALLRALVAPLHAPQAQRPPAGRAHPLRQGARAAVQGLLDFAARHAKGAALSRGAKWRKT